MSKNHKNRKVAEMMELIAETCQNVRELTKAESRLLVKQLELVNSVVNNPDARACIIALFATFTSRTAKNILTAATLGGRTKAAS